LDLLRDGLLIAATMFAGGYCWILSRRVSDLKALDKGLGGSIVTLTRQIELARATLDESKSSANEKYADLEKLVEQARAEGSKLRQTVAVARNAEQNFEALQTRMSGLETAMGGCEQLSRDLMARLNEAPAPRPPEVPQPQPQVSLREEDPAAAEPETPTPAPVSKPPVAETKTPVAEPRPSVPEPEAEPEPVLKKTASPPPDQPQVSGASVFPELPKPRSLPPLMNPLRRRDPDTTAMPRTEDEIVQALAALAAGGR